jgi:threonine aldolase
MERGAEIIVGEKSHLNMWEQGGIAQVGHVYVKQIENLEDGTFDLNRLESMISDHSDRCCSATKLICIENSQVIHSKNKFNFHFVKIFNKKKLS